MSKTLNIPHNELVQKAQTAFWLNGYKGVTVEDLANQLNLSVSTVYNKYGKDELFIEALEMYVTTFSDPTLKAMRESEEGMEAFRELFYMLIDALVDESFPKSCLMINTVLEIRNEMAEVNKIYDEYFDSLRASYSETLLRAYAKGEIKQKEKIPAYAEFLVGLVFGLSVLYKVNSRQQLKDYIDEQLVLLK